MFSSHVTDKIFSALIILLGGYIALTGVQLGYIHQGTPGPGFFPALVGIGLVALALWNIVRAARNRHRLPDILRREAAYVVMASAATAVFVPSAYVTGMLPAILALMLAIGALFGPRDRRFYSILVILCLMMTGMIYLVFNVLLGVPAL
ncbi:tripartite tricarboxylate transporter TctB family protein [Mesorhizobium sp. SB112]|uniref:tripartite tricarboxylate transporter TctB family protein n=1 Tax=Mesorhizobium sp. SB112 TaxID=3151853 RepID=UPI0032644B37